MLRRIFHVDLDAFFVSVEQRERPELKGKPVVVGGCPGSRGVVASASYEARHYGLKAGMSLTRAYYLCPQAIFLSGSFHRYQEASEQFLAILADFTPDIEPAGIDEAYLDISGFEPLYGPALVTARRIKERVREELGLPASIGIASSKVTAKVASDLAKPDGLLEVAPLADRSFLAPLSLDKLPGVGPKTEGLLRNIGVSTVGQLAELPPSRVRHLLGASGELLQRWAMGIDDRKLEPPTAAKSISRETTFAEDTRKPFLLKATLRYLSERVGADLRRQGRCACCVTLKLRYSDFQTITRRHSLAAPSNLDQKLFTTSLGLLEKALSQRQKLVRLIGVGVSDLIQSDGQLDLFEVSIGQLRPLNSCIDRLRQKYGFTVLQSGLTFRLREIMATENGDYVLKTLALSR
ncbi:MAG: DNA polymerase IV [Dehalococcoidales bacterium]|nr:DNA polymerase IV [Dehalococcoidales bacterium]